MDDKKIIEAIESAINIIDNIEGFFEKIDHEFMKGYICKTVDFVEYNLVNGARIPQDKIDETIQEMIDFYTSANLNKMGWLITPSTEPANISDNLEKFGFKEGMATLGMVRPVEGDLDIIITDKFELREIPVAQFLDDSELGSMVERAYGMPAGTSTVFGKIMSSFKENMLDLFVAYSEDKPVAFSRLLYIPNTSVGFLGGAATLPEFRKQGIYSAMLKIRFEKAKENGIDFLTIIAKEGTSAPVAEKNGFRQVCRIPFYFWSKEGTKL